MQVVREILGILNLPVVRNALIVVVALWGTFTYYQYTTGLWVRTRSHFTRACLFTHSYLLAHAYLLIYSQVLGIAVVVLVLAAIAYFWYLNRLYNTTYKPQLLPGIPAIPISHPIHGHFGTNSLIH